MNKKVFEVTWTEIAKIKKMAVVKASSEDEAIDFVQSCNVGEEIVEVESTSTEDWQASITDETEA